MTDRQNSHNKQQNTNQDVRAFDNAHVTAIANIEKVETLIVNKPDRHVLLDDWKPSFEHMQGRKEAIAALNIALADPKKAIACIVGLGGYGKSTLAAKLFDGWSKDKRFWADLSQRSRDFREFATRAIAQLGQKSLEQVNNLPEAQLGYELAAVLQGQGFLVVLDNLESLLDGDGNLESVLWREFLQNWANDGECGKVLITTREEPNLPKLRFFRYELRDGLVDAEGAAVLRDFGILGTEAELVAVSQRVGGIPLSLMLIVGFLCNDYEEEPHVRFLPDDLFGIEGAHRLGWVTTEAVFLASFERLEPRLQSLLMAVSVFAKPFDCTMAAAMIADEEVTDRDLLLLKKRGFVLAESGCYRFQPQIQELVQRQADNLPKLHHSAINFYLTLSEAKSTLDPYHDTLEDADPYLQIFHHYCELDEYESALCTIHKISESFLFLSGYYTKMVELYSRIVNTWHPKKSQQLNYESSLSWLGLAYLSLGQYKEAINFLQQSLEIARSIPDKKCESSSLDNLGIAHYYIGKYEEAIIFHQQSLEIAQSIPNKKCEATSLGNLGNAYHALGKYKKSVEFLISALNIAREIDDIKIEASSVIALGNTYYYLGQYQEAGNLYQRSLDIRQATGDINGEATSLGNLGLVYFALGKSDKAISLFQKQLVIVSTIEDKLGKSNSLCNLGNVYNSLGKYEDAINYYRQLLEVVKANNDKCVEAKALDGLGSAYYSLGKYDKAIDFHCQSLEIKRVIGNKYGEAISLKALSDAYLKTGRIKEGFAASHRAEKILKELQLPLEAGFYPKWFVSIIRFAQRGKWQIALCFCIGLFAFPLYLAYQVALLLWRLIKEKVKSRK